ncbi:hypothetical protein B0H11DRAFT_2264663 [Mycena galericulata]|nr:hypothetical protein B0H11DRAFT_2264663 [Mycena galericulata]
MTPIFVAESCHDAHFFPLRLLPPLLDALATLSIACSPPLVLALVLLGVLHPNCGHPPPAIPAYVRFAAGRRAAVAAATSMVAISSGSSFRRPAPMRCANRL